MSIGFWIAVILTSPFWMVLGIIIVCLAFALIAGILTLIGLMWERFCMIVVKFFDLFKRREK